MECSKIKKGYLVVILLCKSQNKQECYWWGTLQMQLELHRRDKYPHHPIDTEYFACCPHKKQRTPAQCLKRTK